MKARTEGIVSGRGLVGRGDQAWSGWDPRHRVRGAAPAARARSPRPGDQGPLDARRPHRAGRGRLRGRRGRRRAGRRLPIPAHRGAPTAARRGGADPLGAGRPARPAPPRPGARIRRRRVGVGAPLGSTTPCAVANATSGPSTSDSSSGPCSRRSPRSADRLRPPSTGRTPPGEHVASPVMSAEAVARRLAAFGFSDATRTRAAVEDLASGLTRSSRFMAQLLPLLLDWLSLSPDPDLGLLGLRDLVDARAPALASRLHVPGVARGRPAPVPVARDRAEHLSRRSSAIPTSSPPSGTTPPSPPPHGMSS